VVRSVDLIDTSNNKYPPKKKERGVGGKKTDPASGKLFHTNGIEINCRQINNSPMIIV